jgi:hypothetical protein
MANVEDSRSPTRGAMPRGWVLRRRANLSCRTDQSEMAKRIGRSPMVLRSEFLIARFGIGHFKSRPPPRTDRAPIVNRSSDQRSCEPERRSHVDRTVGEHLAPGRSVKFSVKRVLTTYSGVPVGVFLLSLE